MERPRDRWAAWLLQRRHGGDAQELERILSALFGYEEWRRLYYGLDVGPVQHLADRIAAGWKGRKEHPLLDFDERDLFRFARDAGFAEVRMDYRAEVKPEQWTRSWETFRQSSGNPLDPTPEEEMAEALDPAGRAEFEEHLRTLIESRPVVTTWRATAYLHAVK